MASPATMLAPLIEGEAMTDGAPIEPGTGWWSPPPAPQPGVVPLRPLAAGDVLSGSLRTLRRGVRSLVVPAVVVLLIWFVVLGGAIAVVALAVVPRIADASESERGSVAVGSGILAAVALLAATVLGVLLQAILQALLTVGVSRHVLGERPRLAEVRARARGRIHRVVGWTFLFGAAAAVAFGIVFGLSAVLFGSGSGSGGGAAAAVGGLVFFLGGVGLEVVVVWIGVKCCLVPGVLMLEGHRIRPAIARSWRLTRGRFWPTLGALLLTGLIVYVATLAVTLPFSLSAQLSLPFGQFGSSSSSSAPTFDLSDLLPHLVPLIVLTGIGQLLTLVVGAAGLVLVTSAITIVYVDLRSRQERLDLEIVRYAEAREAGDQDPADPYSRPTAG
jgi:hypothetical protein